MLQTSHHQQRWWSYCLLPVHGGDWETKATGTEEERKIFCSKAGSEVPVGVTILDADTQCGSLMHGAPGSVYGGDGVEKNPLFHRHSVAH